METTQNKQMVKQKYYYLKYSIDAVKNSFNYSGRTCRAQFWLQGLEIISLVILLGLLSLIIGMLTYGIVGLILFISIYIIMFIVQFVACLALMVRRVHDFG